MKRIVRNVKNHADLYRIALYLGITGYGGLAVLTQIKKRYVYESAIVSERTFNDALSLAQVLPGSTIINLVAFFSYLRAGLIGAILGTGIYTLPTFLLTTAAAAFYFRFAGFTVTSTMLTGLNILLIPLLTNALIGLGESVWKRQGKLARRSIFISIVSFILYLTHTVGVVTLILIAGAFGMLLYAFTGFMEEGQEELGIVEGALFKRKKAWLLLLAAIIIFGLALYDLSLPLWRLFSSFIRIGLLSFGGGVASLPLMESLFVGKLGWFTSVQFWDGIAISQLTPGPILIVSAFIGYRMAGFLGSFVATVGMLIPSVLLIILAGKIHNRIRHLIIVRNLTTGFLAGFMGMLGAIIIGQIFRTGMTVTVGLLSVAGFVLIRKVKYGILLAALLCFIVPLLLSGI